MDVPGGEQVLAGLVGDDAIARFLDSQRGQRLGFRRRGFRRGIHYGVDGALRELGQPRLRRPGLAGQPARFLNRALVAAGGRGRLTHGSAPGRRPESVENG